MERFFRYFIERPKLVNLALVLVLIMGSMAFLDLKRDSVPKVDFKMVFVTTVYPGAAPEDVEINVTIPIEEALQDVSGVDAIESYSSENFSNIFVEIDPYAKDIEKVKGDITKAVDRVSDLPEEVTQKPIITELKSEVFPVFEVAISSQKNIPELTLRKHAKILEKKIKLLNGVGGTTKVGYRKREIKIEVDPKKADAYYVSLTDIMNSIQASNIRLSGGTLSSLANKKKVIAMSQFDDPKEVGNVIVRSAFSGKRVIVSDIAEVKQGFEEELKIVKANSIPCINIVVSKKSNADAVKVAGEVKKLLAEFNQELPEGIYSQIVKDYSVYVKSMLKVVITNAMVGFLLVLICLMIFLDVRVAFWTALGIPFSLLVAFYFMPIYDISVTTIAMTAFVIVLGMLVDDAIVVSEHIYSYREKGLSKIEASVKGISEIFFPVLATVTTTIAVFLPILLMGGIFGEFLRVMPIVITVTLIASLFEAAFILPCHMAHTNIRAKGKSKLLISLENIYRRTLTHILKHKYFAIFTFVVLFLFASLYIAPRLGFVLFPNNDEDIIMLKIETPKGTPLKETERRVTQIEEIITKSISQDLMASYITTIGEKGTELWETVTPSSQDHWARITINLKPAQERAVSAYDISKNLEKRLIGLEGPGKEFRKISLIADAGGPPVGKPIDVTFVGVDDTIRTNLGDRLDNFLTNYDGVYDIVRNDEEGLKEIQVKMNHKLMSELGLNAAQVATTIRAAISGNVVTSLRKEGEEIDFRVLLKEKYRQDAASIKNITVKNYAGKLIPLGKIISFDEKNTANAIWHNEGDRALRISAEIKKDKLKANEINRKIKDFVNPLMAKHPDFRVIYGGEEKYTQESMQDFFNAFIIALIVVYIILVLLFNSFTEPFIVLLAIPFGLVGVILAFLIHGKTMSFMGLIGILGLSGVVVNNSLVMLKFLNRKQKNVCEKGKNLDIDEVAEAAMFRFRPIILTTITTVSGLLPSLYGWFGKTIDFLFPLLLALAWGLLFSTGITLFLIPAVYMVERQIGCFIHHLFVRKNAKENNSIPHLS